MLRNWKQQHGKKCQKELRAHVLSDRNFFYIEGAAWDAAELETAASKEVPEGITGTSIK